MALRLNKSLLYTFGVGDLFFTLLVNMEIYFFTAFLTDYAQLTLVTVSVVLYVTGFADILCALAAGVVLQRASLRFRGKYRSWLLVGPPLVALLFLLQFSKIGRETLAATIIIVGFLASHFLWNIVFAATGALVGTLTRRPDERTILSSSRAQGMSAAGLLFSLTALPMITFFSARTGNIAGFSCAIAVYGILMVCGYLYVYKITVSGDLPGDEAAELADREPRKTLGEIARLVFRNPPLLLLITAETFRNTSLFITTAFAFYYFGYVLGRPGFLSVFILAISVAALAGTFAATWIGVTIGKRNAYWISLLLGTLAFLSAALVQQHIWGFTIICCIAYGLCMLAGAMSTALFADTVVYGEWKTGKNIQAFTMSLLTLPIKFGLLIRSGVITMGLIAIGFVANATPTPEVVRGISSIMIYAPAATCAIGAVLFYFGYRIGDRDVVTMQDEIAAR